MELIEKRAQSKTRIYDTKNYSLVSAVQDLGAFQQGKIELTGNETEKELIELYINNFDGRVMTANFLENCQEIDREEFEKISEKASDCEINTSYGTCAYDLLLDLIEGWGLDPYTSALDVQMLISFPAFFAESEEDEGVLVFRIADKHYSN